MATSDVKMNFYSLCGKAFVFEESQADMATDSFRQSTIPEERIWLRSKENKFVFINCEEHNFEAQTMNSAQLSKPECQFEVKFYNDNTHGMTRRPVMVYHRPANSGAKPMVACCKADNSVYAEEMDLPLTIEQSAHKAVFLRKEITSSNYELQSSLYKNKYLGFKASGDGLYTLVLIPKAEDEVDEACHICFNRCQH